MGGWRQTLEAYDLHLSISKIEYMKCKWLYTTSSLNIINADIDILVDDMLVKIKVVEEWEFSIGEDVCLFKEDSSCDGSEGLDVHEDYIGKNEAEILVNDMAEQLLKEKYVLEHGIAI